MDVSINEAARHLGVSEDTVRRRIRAGNLLARKEPRPQGFTWVVELEDRQEDASRATHSSTVDRFVIEMLQEQVREKDKQISELHHLLAARSLPEAQQRPWWGFWR